MPRRTCRSSGQMSALPAYAASTCSHTASRSQTSPISSRLSNEQMAVVPSVAHTCSANHIQVGRRMWFTQEVEVNNVRHRAITCLLIVCVLRFDFVLAAFVCVFEIAAFICVFYETERILRSSFSRSVVLRGIRYNRITLWCVFSIHLLEEECLTLSQWIRQSACHSVNATFFTGLSGWCGWIRFNVPLKTL